MQKNTLNIHLITDSTGETAQNIADVIMSQFSNKEAKLFTWSFVQNLSQSQIIIDAIEKNEGIILYTIVEDEIIDYIKSKIDLEKNLVISAVLPLIKQIANFIKEDVQKIQTRAKIADKKIASLEFAAKNDDGKLENSILDADIVLIGISRTSKTPTSMYLAYRGYKVANIPFVNEDLMPKEILQIKESKPIVVGLYMDAIKLLKYRESRVFSDKDKIIMQSYTDLESINLELKKAKAYFSKIMCPTIDITNKSIEEVATQIIKLCNFK